jgi:hypothetical protein
MMVWNLFGYNTDRGQEATEEHEASSEMTRRERNSEEWTFGIVREAPTPKETSNQIFILSSNNSIKAERLAEEKIYQKDYESNCTSLYKKIEEEDWNSVFVFLETGKWPGHFFSDPICPDVQVRTWIRRSDPTDSQKLLWRKLPLHLAIVAVAPYRIIRQLVEMYPESVRCTDSQRHLPVHNAMRHGNPDRVIDYLLSAFPAASESTCRRNDTTATLGCIVQQEQGGMGAAVSSTISSPSFNSSEQLSTHSSDEASHVTMTNSSAESSQLDMVGSTTTRTSVVSILSQMSRISEERIEDLKFRLERKESELGVVQSRLDELNKTKAGIEEELAQNMKRLKCSHSVKFFDDPPPPNGCQGVDATTLINIIKLQQSLLVLEADRHQLELAQQELKTEESDLQYHLGRVQGSVVESTESQCSVAVSIRDLESLKDEEKEIDLENLRDGATEIECRLEESHDNRKEEEATLSMIHRIQPDSRLSDAATKEDIRIIQKTIEDLFRSPSTKDEVAALKVEMDALRRELKDKEEVSRLKVDLILLGNSLERNLKNIKDEKHLADATVAMNSVEARSLENRSIEQLRALKTKLELISAECLVSGNNLEPEPAVRAEHGGSTVQRKQSFNTNDPASLRALREAALSIDMDLLTSRSSTHELQLLGQTSISSPQSQTSFQARIPRPGRYRLRTVSLPKAQQSPQQINRTSSLPADQSKRTTPTRGMSGKKKR